MDAQHRPAGAEQERAEHQQRPEADLLRYPGQPVRKLAERRPAEHAGAERDRHDRGRHRTEHYPGPGLPDGADDQHQQERRYAEHHQRVGGEHDQHDVGAEQPEHDRLDRGGDQQRPVRRRAPAAQPGRQRRRYADRAEYGDQAGAVPLGQQRQRAQLVAVRWHRGERVRVAAEAPVDAEDGVQRGQQRDQVRQPVGDGSAGVSSAGVAGRDQGHAHADIV
ncbi:MAG: hypothetical protein ACRDP9_04415 [Kribbellaceae bacterium]